MPWIIAFVVLFIVIGSCSKKSNTSSASNSSAAQEQAKSIAEDCAGEAGMPMSDNHKVTPDEAREFLACMESKYK